jgi:formylglycine-generating enzyme
VIVGTACGEQPRLPSEEASGISVELAEFDIDAYPYPNDPAKPPMTGVTQAQAKDLCAAKGRRLCTELEWERACKGPSNSRYEYGDKYDAKACPMGNLTPSAPSTAPSCKSAFGVYAMHGFVSEWTSSPWNRFEAQDAGAAAPAEAPADEAQEAGEGSVVLRGGSGGAPYAHMRCSASKKGEPSKKSRTIGFRCCGGLENPATYPMPAEPAAPGFEPVQDPPEKLLARVRAALRNGGFKDPAGAQGNVRSVWRWRPVTNEELFAVFYETTSAEGTKSVQPMVVQLCEKTAQLLGRIKAPIDELSEPNPDLNQGKLELHGKRAEDSGKIAFEYKFGAIVTSQPEWLSPTMKAKPTR